jgi:DNA-binding transcriptional LysR family regulator
MVAGSASVISATRSATAVVNGYGVALAPESAARYYARPGVTYRPLTGVSPSHVGVAWPPEADADPVVQDFVRCCREATTAARSAPGGRVVPGG